MSDDGNRLAAIQMLATLVTPDDPEEHEEVAMMFGACMLTLGVDIQEIRDAMNFAILAAGETE